MSFVKRELLFLTTILFILVIFSFESQAQTAQIFCVRNTGGVVNFRSRSTCLKGEKQLQGFGNQGPAGAQGPTGPQGATGAQGPAGEPAPDSFAADPMAPDDSLYVDQNGDMGLGTTSPDSKFTIVAGQLTGTNTFGFPDVIFPEPALTLKSPDVPTQTFIQPNSGIHTLLHLNVNPWFRANNTGVAIKFGFNDYSSRIVHYGDVGNSFGSRLALQTHSTGLNMHNPGIKIYENNAVTIGVEGDPLDAPGSSGDLIVGGYTQLATVVGSPPALDCDQVAERGRMKVDSAAGVLWICMNSGWVSK